MRFYALISSVGDSQVAEFPDCPECVAVAGPSEDIGRNAAAVLRAWLEAKMLAGGLPPLPSSQIPRRPNARARGIEVPPLLALRISTRQARAQHGRTTAEFAAELGVAEPQLAALEHPAGEPSERTIGRVTKELGLQYVPPSRRTGAAGQADLFPASRRASIIRPFLSVSAYDAETEVDEDVQLELTFRVPPSLWQRMQGAASASGASVSDWLVGLARTALAADAAATDDPAARAQLQFRF